MHKLVSIFLILTIISLIIVSKTDIFNLKGTIIHNLLIVLGLILLILNVYFIWKSTKQES